MVFCLRRWRCLASRGERGPAAGRLAAESGSSSWLGLAFVEVRPVIPVRAYAARRCSPSPVGASHYGPPSRRCARASAVRVRARQDLELLSSAASSVTPRHRSRRSARAGLDPLRRCLARPLRLTPAGLAVVAPEARCWPRAGSNEGGPCRGLPSSPLSAGVESRRYGLRRAGRPRLRSSMPSSGRRPKDFSCDEYYSYGRDEWTAAWSPPGLRSAGAGYSPLRIASRIRLVPATAIRKAKILDSQFDAREQKRDGLVLTTAGRSLVVLELAPGPVGPSRPTKASRSARRPSCEARTAAGVARKLLLRSALTPGGEGHAPIGPTPPAVRPAFHRTPYLEAAFIF